VTQIHIRPYRASDLEDLYRVCLETGDNGQDATAMFDDDHLLGHVFAAPYGVFEPSLAFVAEDEAGVGGYVLGALDSRAFERTLESGWWPGLRARYPEPPPSLAADHWTPDQRMAHLIHHPLTAPEKFVGLYPSHLHIDLVPRMQSRGAGRQMMDTVMEALRERDSAGLHLFVTPGNLRAASFYRHLHFTELALVVPDASGESSDGPRVFAKDLR
jgi:ribosomal protein S18 acetylase RimI-like enzyme